MIKKGFKCVCVLPPVWVHCFLWSAWTAGHAWSLLPSSPRCLGIDSCSHSVARCIGAACRKRSLSPRSVCALSSCASAACRWPARNLAGDGRQRHKEVVWGEMDEVLCSATKTKMFIFILRRPRRQLELKQLYNFIPLVMWKCGGKEEYTPRTWYQCKLVFIFFSFLVMF